MPSEHENFDWIEWTNDAVLARLRANTLLADKVYEFQQEDEGDPSPLPLPYVMVFSDTATHRSDRAANQSENALFNYTLHVAGSSRTQVNATMAEVVKQLLNWRPVVPGRTCWKMAHNFSTPLNTRDDLRPPLFYIVDEWALQTTKGTS